MKIGELASRTGTSTETIRCYEQIGLMQRPSCTSSNYPDYEERHVHRLAFIRRARALGFPIDQVRELLSLADEPGRSCAAVDRIARAQRSTVERKLAELKALGAELDHLIGQCGNGRISDCRIIEALADAGAST